jgi:GNAT superfamily N-acetyltransferase
VRLVDLDGLSHEDWERVVAGEPEPFGGVGEELEWREKTRYIGVMDDDEQLVAYAGLVAVDVRVAEAAPFTVAGVGGVIVTKAARGRGLGRMVIERILEIAPELGLERAMLFCIPRNVPLYEKFGFHLVEDEVWADQPTGPVEMPIHTMWKPLTPAATWPPGRVEVLGEPF